MVSHHDTVSAVGDGITNIANLGSRGSRVLDHGLEHLGCADDGLAGNVAHGNNLLLRRKHLGGGNLDTQVTASNHDTVGLGQDLGKVVETLSVLNLGDDLDVAALLTQNVTNVLDVLASPDKGCDSLGKCQITKKL